MTRQKLSDWLLNTVIALVIVVVTGFVVHFAPPPQYPSSVKTVWAGDLYFTPEEVRDLLNRLTPERAARAKIIAIASLGTSSFSFYVWYEHETS